MLSALENPVSGQSIGALDVELLTEYRSTFVHALTDDEFDQVLVDSGILANDGSERRPTGFGLILFGKSASEIFGQSVVKVLYTGEQGDVTKSFEGPLIRIAKGIGDWLDQMYPQVIDRSSGLMRQDANKDFRVLAREGIVNALVHRDYGIGGAKIQIEATSNSICIKSPGEPIDPITLEQLQSFQAPTLSRNPLIHRVLSRLKFAEEQRLGMRTLRAYSPKPTYKFETPYLVLELRRALAGPQSLTDGESNALSWLERATEGSSTEYAAFARINSKSARERLNSLVGKGLATRSGKARATRYQPVPGPANRGDGPE